MEAEVIGKRVDRGRGNRLEILVRYLFLGPAKAIDWLKRKLETVEEEYHKLFNIIITNFITANSGAVSHICSSNQKTCSANM